MVKLVAAGRLSSATALQLIASRLDRATQERVPAPARRPTPLSSERLAAEIGRRLDAGLPIAPTEGNRAWAYRVGKRVFDFCGALALLALLAPVMLLALAALTITTRGKPIFVQERIGYRGRKFPMLKFRTMHLDADRRQRQIQNEQDGPIFKNRRDPRITPLGRWLRKTSIDETPQLLNVLAGHMALVGPRPPVEKEVRQYELWQLDRLAIAPGLTCLWQVSGRSEIGFQDWVRMDLWYARNQNFKTDLELLIRTPLSVLSGRGAY
jgi:lipopolysaccharide/colanic/teichoic acid biosynthesis glycosyltransferase